MVLFNHFSSKILFSYSKKIFELKVPKVPQNNGKKHAHMHICFKAEYNLSLTVLGLFSFPRALYLFLIASSEGSILLAFYFIFAFFLVTLGMGVFIEDYGMEIWDGRDIFIRLIMGKPPPPRFLWSHFLST